MSIKALTSHPGDLFRAVFPKAPELMELPRSVRKIGGDSITVSSISVAELQRRIIVVHEEGKIRLVKHRELRSAVSCFFEPPEPLAAREILREDILEIVIATRHKTAVWGMIAVYLEKFDPKLPGFTRVAAWLDEAVRLPFWNWEWSERAKEYRLFVPEEAPNELARRVMEHQERPDTVLEDAGLSQATISGNLGEAVFAAGCRIVARFPLTRIQDAQTRLIDWGLPSGRFLFSRAFPDFAAALLFPWVRQQPPDAHQALLSQVLISIAGDPRVRPVRWESVQRNSPESFSTLLRWLTRAAVYQFFDIVDQIADDHMWRYRRAFWTSYLEDHHIEEAWVVFGRNGAALAERVAGRQQPAGTLQFGRLGSGGGKTPNHAALIIRLGDLTIVEWSHNGKYAIWPPFHKNAPGLYRPEYDTVELMWAPESGSHMGSDNYKWQNDVAKLIRQYTGRSTPQVSWRPEASNRK